MNNENQTINLQDVQDVQAAQSKPMKWYKFLIYFALWAAAIVYLGQGISAITARQYAGYADQVYAQFPAMKFADVAVGVLYIGLAVLAIVARFALAKFKKSGPALTIAYYAGGLIVNLVYAVASSMLIGQSVFTSNLIASFVGTALAVILNAIYFNKRKHMFVN